MPFYKIAETIADIAFNKNNLCNATFGGKQITLAKKETQLYAFAEKCPHAGSLLSEGHLDAKGCIVCPLHGYRFALQNGRNISGEGYQLKIFPTEKREDGCWYIEI
ncbi:Rieske (2Fe-2S) protein [Arachidicoccus soli]|uniref:(2Fe-2S)-binding protein n=1 Tax=Arachidicoccus soli TaxID=2341117 RepID=A0A386HTG6_9BACT|nr:Rieske 2Fe-2S domain-containing protein [Arachidicoccus soli]AYD49113.1 (2Fe-2S)-binding protein [Arachidicoccus soli]